MARWILVLLALGASLYAQPPLQSRAEPKDQKQQPAKNDEIEAPPEEDLSLAVTKYSFNPLQSEKDVRVGNYYAKMHNYHAAALRYLDATKWNDGNSDAWLRLATASEKAKDIATARDAYGKYLKLEPDSKDAAEIRKKLAKLK